MTEIHKGSMDGLAETKTVDEDSAIAHPDRTSGDEVNYNDASEIAMASYTNLDETKHIAVSNQQNVHRDPISVHLTSLSIAIERRTFFRSQPLKSKMIIHPITAYIPGGTLFAILGGSGSGKTTLLNVLAGRYDKQSIKVQGEIDYRDSSSAISSKRFNQSVSVGFVTQTDFLLPFLTVLETLTFVANLQRLKTHISRDELVANIILDLGLKECADILIVSISGGQKRRVSVAIQILSDPEVLCADEPTSGLDSFTANTVMEALQRLTQGTRHTTIICSIHQPRADVFRMFDSVLLLSKGGKTAYCGPTRDIVTYFSSLGFQCPEDSNPADYFVDLVSIDHRSSETEHEDEARVKYIEEQALSRYAEKGAESSVAENNSSQEFLRTSQCNRVSWFLQVAILSKRFFINTYHNRADIFGAFFQSAWLGLVIMGIFYQLGDSQRDIQSRSGLMYIFISSEAYILLIVTVQKLSEEVKIFDRELQDGMYVPSAYFLAHLVTSLPLIALQTVIYGLPIYFGCNLRNQSLAGFNFLALSIIMGYTMNGLAWMSISISRVYAVASLVSNMSFTFIGLTSGFLVNTKTLPVYVAWVRYLSFHYYSYKIAMSNEFTDREFQDCSSGSCVTTYGNAILHQQGIARDDYASNWPAVFAICIIYYGIALLLLNYLKFPPTGIAGGLDDGKEIEAEESSNHSKSQGQRAASAHSNPSYQQIDTSNYQSKSMHEANGLFASPPSIAVSIKDLSVTVTVYSLIAANSNRISIPYFNDAEPKEASNDPQGNVQDTDDVRSLHIGITKAENIDPSNGNPIASTPIDRTTLNRGLTFLDSIRVVDESESLPTSPVHTSRPNQTTRNFFSPSNSFLDLLTPRVSVFNRQPASTRFKSVKSMHNTFYHENIYESRRSMTTNPHDEEGLKGNHATSFRKKLLTNISAKILPGRLVALMGGSGSGKTTLLNVIAGRVAFSDSSNDSHMAPSRLSSMTSYTKNTISSCFQSNQSIGMEYHKSGEILFDKKSLTVKEIQNVVGYVQQNDYHLPSLTVRETLQFHADLRISRLVPRRVKIARVLHVSRLLGLQECLDVRVGNEELKGISGGEKRRLSVAVQLLLDPSICLLDEPTTGLDTFTARHVIETLRELAKSGRTVILSIHQPRYDVFACLDDVILLARGRQVWAGASKEMLSHLARFGYSCPSLTNPADFILDISSIDFRTEEQEMQSRKRLQFLVDMFDRTKADRLHELEQGLSIAVIQESPSEDISQSDQDTNNITASKPVTYSLRPKSIPTYYALGMMMYRAFLNQFRQPLVISSRISQVIFYALILAAFYAPVQSNQAAIQNMLGNLYEFTALAFIGMLNCMAIFPSERDVFFREYLDGGFSSIAFFLTYFILALPFILISAGSFSLLMAYAVGLQPTGEAFGVFLYTTFWFVFAGECIGVAFCSHFNSVGVSANLTSLIISVFCIMSGNISVSMSVVLEYINYISPLKYGAWLLNNVIFRGRNFSCDVTSTSSGCQLNSGDDVLKLYQMYETPSNYRKAQGSHMWAIMLVGMIYFLCAFLALQWRVRSLTKS